jgi:23S rRNA (cytidine1920-2'-O)/16S rRNA (cytidine1409-2'-O)-methyltransferase
MKTKNSKVRLDKLLVERGISPTRERAKALIMSGSVALRDNIVDKAGTLVSPDVEITIKGRDNPYVSRGGLKLKGALSEFGIDVKDFVALDIGASTGGFTDCLLQEGARKVYAVDVGYGQLAWKLRQDERVVVFERTNIRHFSGEDIEDEIDIVTIDVSFISLKLVIPVALRLSGKNAAILALIKPQFEVGKGKVSKGGVVKDPEMHKKVVNEIMEFSRGLNLNIVGTCESPLKGPAGNKEFFLYARK